MDVTIIIPCVRLSRFLEKVTLPAIAAHTPGNVRMVIAHEPDLNVSECRQKWMELAETRYVYFMDVDSVIDEDEWLEKLMDLMEEHQAGAVTPQEHWGGKAVGGEEPFERTGYFGTIRRTAGAGCLYDTRVGAWWDPNLGETYGYIGRELEDVDFALCIRSLGFMTYGTDIVSFCHDWHDENFKKSDERAMWEVVGLLIEAKWTLPPGRDRDSFFRLIHPLQSRGFEKNHDIVNYARGRAAEHIYGDIVEYWGGDASLLRSIAENGRAVGDGLFPRGLTTPEQRGVEDVWSKRYRACKPRSPK
jgi:glycosyltransferase involved in cell wall biosynthesis